MTEMTVGRRGDDFATDFSKFVGSVRKGDYFRRTNEGAANTNDDEQLQIELSTNTT